MSPAAPELESIMPVLTRMVSAMGMFHQLTNDSELIALTFIGSHVAAAGVLRVWTRLTALITLQQMTEAICAASWVACI
jgi:hypothetical protein